MSPALNPRKPFGPRRIAVFALLAIVLAGAAWLYLTHAAGISGMSTKDMDWDGDGTATHQEILQAFYAVGVSESREGQRECSNYYWRRDRQSIRVECRTTMTPATEQK